MTDTDDNSFIVDNEKELLKDKIRGLENKIEETDSKKVSLDEYLRDMKIYSDIPKDQYGHQFKLLFHPSSEISVKSKRSDLFNPDILLGHIKDSKTLYFFQRDFAILHRLYDMGLRSPGVMDLFNNLYYPWVGQIRLTGALGGTERWLQSFLEPTQQAFESFSFSQKQMEKKKRKGLREYMSGMRKGRDEGGNIYD